MLRVVYSLMSDGELAVGDVVVDSVEAQLGWLRLHRSGGSERRLRISAIHYIAITPVVVVVDDVSHGPEPDAGKES